MTLSTRTRHFPVIFFSLAAVLFLLHESGRSMAQGLSGPPQRLEETLGQRGQNQGGTVSGSDSAPSRSGPAPGPTISAPGGGSGQDDMDMEMEMDMEEMYDDGYGDDSSGYPPSASRARATGTPQADAMQTYGGSLISLMEDLDLSPLFLPAPQAAALSGPVLAREAEQAFVSGNRGLALELMFGHMATEYQDALVALRTVKYSRALKRPVWSIRWGVSMAVRGDASADAQPIREGATPSRNLASGGGGFGGEEDFAGMDDEMEQQMQQEMEEQMEQEMEMEMDMDMEGMSRGPGGRGGAFGRGPTTTRPAIPVRNMLSAEAGETLDGTIGLVAKVVAEQFAKRFQQGDFGPHFASVTAPEPVAPIRGGGQPVAAAPMQSSMSAELNDALSEAAEPLPMWQPGLVFLGLVDSYIDMIPAARADNIDLVLHFDVTLKPGRNNTMQNISRCRLINVATAKSVVVSKGMDSWEAAQKARIGKGERAYVEEGLSNLFAIIDRDVKVIDLPGLSPDVARRRIATLISSPTSRTLRTLAEIRLYQAQELIDMSEVEAAFDIVGGVDALMLLHGALDERIAMARKWAVESQGSGDR